MYGVINKEYILERVSQQEIFEEFSGLKVKPGVMYRSPFRNDKHPTGEFRCANGKIRFVDYSGDFHGDCFDAVQRLYGVDYYKSLDIIAEKFGLIQSQTEYQKRQATTRNIEREFSNSRTTIELLVREWEKEDLDYWNKFEINLKTLNFFKVFPAKYVFVNSRVVYRYTRSNPGYAYRFGDKEYKVYFPLRKDKRFINNSVAIQGLEQLPKEGKLLILTKSLKDVMVLRRFGLYAIAFQTEAIIPSEKDLQPFFENWDRVVSLYDFDPAGVRSANKMKKLYGIQPFFLTPEYGAKDAAEYVERHGRYEAFKLKELWMKYLS